MVERQHYIISLSEEEARQLREKAKEENLPFGEYCRKKLMREI
ncbi:MAG: hypothetical protein ACOC5T_10400 [Elusimicrobiota bacterium]